MISTYSELKTAVGKWLNEESAADIDTLASEFIQLAEATMQRDEKIRRDRVTTLTADSGTVTAPTDFKGFIDVWHAGPTSFFELDTVSPGMLSEYSLRYGLTGTPRAVAVVDQTQFMFGPEPDGEYDLRVSYWETIPHLGGITQSNWLLERSPDIYLYAALVESALFYKDSAMLGEWSALYDKRVEQLHRDINRARWSGKLERRARPIGGRAKYAQY